MNREEIERDLRKHLAAHPADAGHFLAVIAAGLADYEAAVKRQREALATTAIGSLLLINRPPWIRNQLGFMIDPAMHQFPAGPAGASLAEKKFWGEFLSAAGEHPLNREWLAETRGHDALEWWDRVVAPALEAKEDQ